MSGVDIAGLVEELKRYALHDGHSTDTHVAMCAAIHRAADALLAQAAELAEAREHHAFATIGWEKERGLRDEALAALKASEEALRPFANLADYLTENSPDVPDTEEIGGIYAGDIRRARAALENGTAGLADATNNPPSDPGTEQREAGR